MPYTPPSRSPAASSSPVTTPGPRPALPRSNSSTSYLQRHRRSPSVQLEPHGKAEGGSVASSIRQSPPPVTDGSIPAGAILSPPDSTQNSSDDEASPQERQPHNLDHLHEAVRRSFDTTSNSGAQAYRTSATNDSESEASTPMDSRLSLRLSASARKISHSRSATESSFFDINPSQSTSSSLTQSDESDEDGDESTKPPLLRKKSGELVKPAIRPQSRRKHSSVPGTPTFSKAVHFNEDIEQVRHFLQVDRPIAVSAGASPVESHEEESEFPFGHQSSQKVDWELRMKNFPRDTLERMAKPVRLERLYLSPDQKSLIGVVAVANLAFHKQVVARFTFDYWKTTSEVTAEYNNDLRSAARKDGYDQFNFSLKLSDQANLQARTLLLCIRYNAAGNEHWDNNDHMNFQVDFARREKSSTEAKPQSVSDSNRPIPRSRHSSVAANTRPWSMSSLDDDFTHGFDANPIKFKRQPTGKMDERDTQKRTAPGGAQFSTRYDFGASLSAALTHAQQQLGARSGLNNQAPTVGLGFSKESTLGVDARNAAQSARASMTSPTPDSFLANRQSLDSRAYQEFVSKYCFFGSDKSASPATSSHPTPGVDGSQDKRTNEANIKGFPGFSSSPHQTLVGSPSLSPNSHNSMAPASPSYGFPFSTETSGLLTPDFSTTTAIRG